MSKDSSARYYQPPPPPQKNPTKPNKKRLQKRLSEGIKIFLKKKQKKETIWMRMI